MNEKYQSIIGLKYDGVKNHKRMSRIDRAAQFAPFAALTGFDDEIEETNRMMEEETIFSEDSEREIDDMLNRLKRLVSSGNHPLTKITFFIPDEKKKGGEYETENKRIKKINETEKFITTTDGDKILFSSLAALVIVEE